MENPFGKGYKSIADSLIMPERFIPGKLPKELDLRTIQWRDIRRSILPPLPAEFDVDASVGLSFPARMWLNNMYGCCEVASIANQSLRFEGFEQDKVISIWDQDIKRTYFLWTGGGDDGLVMLKALNRWRKDGWQVGGQRKCFGRVSGGQTLKIHAYAEVVNEKEVMQIIHLLRGGHMGMQVSRLAYEQAQHGIPWTVPSGDDGGIVGGHAIYAGKYGKLSKYDKLGTVGFCWTWGRLQPFTWDFYHKYFDEGYGVVDAANRPGSPVDEQALLDILGSIAG